MNTFGKVLLEHALRNEANFSCSCDRFPRTSKEDCHEGWVAHVEAAMKDAGIVFTTVGGRRL